MELNDDERQKFKEVYQVLKEEILQDPAFEHDEISRQRIEKLLDYNVPGGKKYRALLFIEFYKLLVNERFSEDELFRACVLGWVIQWAFAAALILDDIMDNANIRRGKPCWFRLPQVGLSAINDGVLIWCQAYRIFKRHFKDTPCYVDLTELIKELSCQTSYGQMIDLITPLDSDGEEDLLKYTSTLYRRICLYKTSYTAFYGAFAAAMVMSGKKLDEVTEEKNIFLDMGIYFQSQDDYLDCYGDPKLFGKLGTDIEESKCSWLIVKALELCNEEQKKLLCDNYMKADPTSVDIVKSVYKELNLEAVFAQYEEDERDKIMTRIEALPSKAVQQALKISMSQTFKRIR